MINRVAHKDLAKGYLRQNGNQSGMAGAEILYRVLATITGGAFGGAFIALGVYRLIFDALASLLGGVLVPLFAVVFTVITTMLTAAIVAPFAVGRGRYYLHLRKNGSRTSVTKLFEGYDYFLEFANVEARRQFSILWMPTAIMAVASLVSGIIVVVCGGVGGLLGSASGYYNFYGYNYGGYAGAAQGVAVGVIFALLIFGAAFIAAAIIKIYRDLQLWAVEWILADHPGMKADQVLHYSRQITKGHIWDLFIYKLSFLGWQILSWLTGGIMGFVYVDPYYNMTSALLYEELKGGAIELEPIPGNSNLQDLSRRVKPMDGYPPVQPHQPSQPVQPAQAEPALRGVAGMYAGSVFKIKPDQTVVLGRDPKQAQIVFSQGADKISRRHCSVMFSSRLGQYQVVDHSSNGTFVSGSRLQLNVPVTLPRGTQLALGSNDNIIRLE